MGFLKNIYHYGLAWLASLVYRHPSRKLIVIGITGTKGKTTSVELLHAALRGAGFSVAMLSSAHVKYNDEVSNNPKSNTMPGRFFIQRFLRTAVSKGCTHAIFEVTSQGVVQHRHRFIEVSVAALTNLHPEHIESHGSFENYRNAKVSFFSYVTSYSANRHPVFFINEKTVDQDHFARAAATPMLYSRNFFQKEILHGDLERLSSWLRSDFNLDNAALVYAIATYLGADPKKVLDVFARFVGVAGRLEFVRGAGKTAIIDYALTPDSLRAVYVYVQSLLQPSGRLLAVFGSAGGGRDTWKRPELGAVADEFCEKIFLTTDDPYDEDPAQIIEDIAGGITHSEKVVRILNRAEAITAALREAKAQDIVVITGMGSQTATYGPRGSKKPWSDKKATEEALTRL